MDIGWLEPSNALDALSGAPERYVDKSEHVFAGVPNWAAIPPGLYMAIEVNERDTHGAPSSRAAYFKVDKVPERRHTVERTSAEALFGAKP